jgi:transcriptional regulator with XRE-family HTH domain
MPRDANVIGPKLAWYRNRNGWAQEELVTQLTVYGCYMTRNILASIENRRCPATDKQIEYFAFIFRIGVQDLFPEKRHFSGERVGTAKEIPRRRKRNQRKTSCRAGKK